MNKLPLVSIIMPTYNSKFVEHSIDSVLGQSYQNWELLITDDCSTDATWDVLNKTKLKDSRIKVFKLSSNKGAGLARNNSIKKAKGTYIAFLDSDDLWQPNKLEVQIKYMIENKIYFSHTSYTFINEEGISIKKPFLVGEKPVGYKQLLKNLEIGCLTAVYNADKMGKMYMPDVRRKQDFGLWLSILKKGYYSHPIQQKLALYRVTKNQATNNKLKLISKHYSFLRKNESLNLFKSLYYTFFWGYNGFIKHYISKLNF